MRECTCERGINRPFETYGVTPTDPTYQCRKCWLYHNDPRWKAAGDGKPIPEIEIKFTPPPQRPACKHLGAPTGERQECPTCTGKVQVKLMACAVFGKCSPAKALDGIACCLACQKYEPSLTPPTP